MFQNIFLSEYHWNLPWRTLARRFILLANLQNKFELGRRDDSWCYWLTLMYICPLGKNPIFPHTTNRTSQLTSYIVLSVSWFMLQDVWRVATANPHDLCRRQFTGKFWKDCLVWSDTACSGLYYKTITIVSDATILSVTCDCNWRH